jgi:anthranilate phosphoribosyltransferase|tara:strand:- start:559 stop:1578 length:1020 start_codon:yes stop_codon:yes gene_type:complete
MIKEAIANIVAGIDLTQLEASEVMVEIMEGEATDAQLSAFLVALRMKGETVNEISGLAMTMRDKALSLEISNPSSLLDTCGTGGDSLSTFNISTAAALVAAGADIKIAKHGNRAASSSSGSADVLETLGVKIDLGPTEVAKSIEDAGIGFMFAPRFHPAMRYAAGPRREIGLRTIMNILGPLTNPAKAGHQIVGVADGSIVEIVANVLAELGAKHAIVVHGDDGLDEISLSGSSTIVEYKDGKTSWMKVNPEKLGLTVASIDQIRADGATSSAGILTDILDGQKGAHRDVVLLNAGAALLASDLVSSLEDGVQAAKESIDSFSARSHLESFIKVTNSFS